MDEFDGFVISGGADIDPELYSDELREEMRAEISGENRRDLKDWLFMPLVFVIRFFSSSTNSRQIDRDRDRLELDVIDRAFKNDKPLLGICRGMQLMNIYFNGTLFEDIVDFYVEYPHIYTLLPKKYVNIKKPSILYRAVKHKRYLVNSLHHQSIDKLGDALIVSATEDNGIVQAIEREDVKFFLGLQWHPEYLLQLKPQRAIFKALANAVISNKEH